MADDRHIPVVIGVGQILDRSVDDAAALDSRGLMLAALRRAEADVGRDVLHRLDWLGVEDQISFPDVEIAERLAADLPAPPRHVYRTEEASGTGPTAMMNHAANLIGSGEVALAAITGGEALRTAARRARAGQLPATDGGNRVRAIAERATTPLARRYGLAAPTDIYPLYENAIRAAWGMNLSEAQAESATLWAGMSDIAAGNPHAWITTPVSAEEILNVSPNNRIISHPYPKLMVANSGVNMGAAILVASLAAARELGLDERRLVYLGQGAGADEPADYLRRDAYNRSASLEATIAAVLDRNALRVDDLDLVELYSCFPCIPKMARRALGWPASRPISVYGGLTFGGGPIGNCMAHAAAAMVERLRGEGGTGLIVANGGYATHNHALILTAIPQPAGLFPHEVSVQREADALRGPIPDLLDAYEGPGVIETYGVPYRDGAPSHGAVVARTPDGQRFLAHVAGSDDAIIGLLTDGDEEPVGRRGMGRPTADGRIAWIDWPS